MIEVASKDEAERVMDRLEDGEAFADLAPRYHSMSILAKTAGRSDWSRRMIPCRRHCWMRFNAGARDTGPISLTDTYAIVYVKDIIEPQAPSEESVREAVRALALEQAVSLSELERQLREKYEARISAGTVTL